MSAFQPLFLNSIYSYTEIQIKSVLSLVLAFENYFKSNFNSTFLILFIRMFQIKTLIKIKYFLSTRIRLVLIG